MKRRITALLLAFALILSLLPVTALAASTEEEALGEVDIYHDGAEMSYLSINGRVRTQTFTYYNHVNAQGQSERIPAYCVNPNTAGVPQTVPAGQGIKYLANERATDPKVMGIVASGYPHRSLDVLGLDSEYDAYYATKMALWAYLLPHWNVNNFVVNPALTGAEKATAEKVLAATKDIYSTGMCWTRVLSPRLTVTAEQEEAYPTTIDGQDYYRQDYSVETETWAEDGVVNLAFADPSNVPEGAKIINANGNECDLISVVESTGTGFGGKFSVIYPASSIAGKSGNIQVTVSGAAFKFAIFYAECAEVDKYGNLQNYMCDTDPLVPLATDAYSTYGGATPPPTPEEPDEPDTPAPEEPEEPGNLVILKVESGTNIPLEGAIFEVIGPNGDTVGSFSTQADGTIQVPVTEYGNFTVIERVPPRDHLLSEHNAQNVTVRPGETAQLTFANDPYGDLRVEKYSDTGEGLAGVVVEIKHIETGRTLSGITEPGGAVQFTGLQPGGYEVREVSGIQGWIADTTTVKTVSVVTGETASVSFVNKELPGLKIEKYDRVTGDVLSGITFRIWRDGELLGDYHTGVLGEILLTDVKPGTFLVQEVSTDDDHLLDGTPQQIELHAGDGIKQLIFFNDKKPGLHLTKVDSANPSIGIPNAVFKIEAVDGSFGPEEFVTDQNGEIDLSKLPAAAYVVTEVSCPGYEIDDGQRIIQLGPNENANFVFTNKIRPSLELIKLSSDGKPLKGVTFRIAKIEDGSHYLDRTTDAQGKIVINDLDPGVYSVRETATVSDHIIDLREHHVELFAGKTSTLIVENQKRPNLIVYKHDADTGAPVPNTIFEVRAADSHSVDEITTGPDGKAELKNLLPGVYEIREKDVPAPYLLDASSQLVTLYANRDHTAHFQNHKKPTLTVRKIDSITGGPVEGAKFQIQYRSNNTSTGEINDLGIFYSDARGQIIVDDLRDGWYKISELEPPAGYGLKEPSTQEVYIKGGESKTVTFENVPLSALVVWKYDSVTGEAVEGARFSVRYLGGTSGTGGTLIGIYDTAANGSFTVTGLEAGSYLVEELASDSNHVIDTAPQTAYISGKDQDVVELFFGNSPKGSLLVKKIDSITHEPLSDVEFFVTTSDGTVVGNANGKFWTDSKGTFILDGITPGTTLVVKEVRAKDGYILDDTPQTAQIRAGQTVTLEFRNQPKGGLIIRKIDSVTKEPLAGVKFKITTASGELVPDNEGLTSTNGLYTTNERGEILLSNLKPNTYIVSEEETLPDYILDAPPQTVVVDPADTQTLTFTNTPKGCLLITKVDAVTKEPLSGVQFQIKGCNGCEYPAGTYTTDSDGTIKLSHIPSGCYAISETRAKDGYLLDDTVHTVKVEGGTCKEVAFENAPLGGLLVKKMDAVTKEPLADVIFKVTRTDGTVVGSSNGEYRTDERGYISIPDLEPGGYVVWEAREKSGYRLDDTPKTIQIKDHRTYTLEFFNQPLGGIVIHKLDSSTKEPLEGVQFKITYADGSVVDDEGGALSSNGLYWTDENGQIIIDGITGTLVVTEEKTVPGYTIHEETRSQTVVVNPHDTQHLYFYNDPIGGVEIIKVDEANKAKRIPNTTFEIRRVDDELVDTVTTDRDGRVSLPLEDGSYYAVETEAGEGYKLDSTPIYFEVENGKCPTITVTNKAISGILIHKVNSATNEGIYGVDFLLYDSGKNPVGLYTSDDKGYVYIEGLNAGRYYLRELENEGYIPDTQLKTVYVKSGETTEITWKNTAITGQIQVTKTSEDYNSMNGWPAGTPIPNTIFEIYNARTGKLMDTIKTDKNGIAVSKLLPLGRYKIVESKAADFYGLDKTPIEVEIEFAGQIVKAAMTNKSLYTNVSIKKTGYVEVMPGQIIRYDFSGIANNSTTALTSFYWRDVLPTQAVRLEKLVTGTWNTPGNYKVVYRTNLSGENWRTLADNLSTQKNYVLDASPAALGLASNEYVTEFMVSFGVVPGNFRQVEAPQVYCMVGSWVTGGTKFTNTADAGGVYDGQWIMAVSRWVTTVYKPSKPLPRTGY